MTVNESTVNNTPKRAGSGSVIQWHRSADPDLYQNVTDPEHSENNLRQQFQELVTSWKSWTCHKMFKTSEQRFAVNIWPIIKNVGDKIYIYQTR